MKHRKQITAAALSVALLGSVAVPAYAEPEPKEKEEVVYAMTDASGAVRDIEVVNIFDGGNITDYGDYSAVKILNTTDKIKQEDRKISISSDADKVYYQGTVNGNVIPWNISIRYYLDGKEYSASEMAGKSGALKIRFSVSKNKKCAGSFYEDYALQTSFTMDAEKFKNITADGAAFANVGSDKQLTYTILPGKGIDTVIKANVTDFEMDAVSVNGIKLNLDVEIDDEELKSKVNDLIDAVKQLDDGAAELYAGSGELRNGSSGLKNGASSLHSGSAALNEGVLALQSGLNTVQNGLNSLNMQSAVLTKGSAEFKAALKKIQTAVNSASASEADLTELVTASGKIKRAINDLNTGAASLQENLGYAQYKAVMAQNGLNIDELKAGNANALKTIKEYQSLLEKISQMPEYKEILAQYRPGLPQEIEQIAKLLGANNVALGGMESYLNGVSGKLPELTDGLAELNAQYKTFDNAIGKLVTDLGSMTGNLSALADGINRLTASYENLDSGIGIYTDGVAQIAAGYSRVMTGVSSLAKGSKELAAGSGELYDGTAELYDGVVSLCGGAKEMADGTGKFREETSGMNDEMEEEIDSILDAIGGDMENPVSFASSQNTNVDSVQFVIRTDAIETEEIEETKAPAKEKPSLIQKFLNLFK